MGKTGKLLVAAIVLLMLSSAPVWASEGPEEGRDGSRATLTVQRFVEHRVPVDVNFETSATNSTYHLSVPNSATVTAASITLEGLERYSLKGTPNSFDDPVGHYHLAYYGQIGRYPPIQSPSNYKNIQIDPRDIDPIKRPDGSYYETSTPFGANPPNYPYHHFDMVVNTTGMVRLKIEWVGSGYCVGNDTNTHGAEAYLWNYTGLEWLRIGRYAANDTTGTTRTFTRTLRDPSDFTDLNGHINVLVFGQHDEPQGGGWTDPGSVSTDYVAVTVLKNDTIESPREPALTIGDGGPFWSRTGDFTTSVTLAVGSGFQVALQSYIDSKPPAPGTVEVPFEFSVERASWGEIRVSDLSVTVREVDNEPPVFLEAREVTMTEDEDLVKAFDLQDHFDDDYQGPDLMYAVESAENDSAVQAVIHTDGHHVNLVTVAEHWAGSLEFLFNATDAWGLTTSSTAFTITVEEVNDPPWIEDPGDIFLDEDVPFELNLSYFDPDIPYGDTLTFEDSTSLFEIDPYSGRISFTPDQEDIGKHDVTVTVRDYAGESFQVSFSVTIVDLNDAPVIEDPGLLVVDEDTALDFNFTVNDEDGDTQFTWVLVGGVGTMKIGPYDGRLSWIPAGEHVGITNISVICTDRRGSSDQLNVSIEVRNVNDVPVLADLKPAQMVEGSPFSYTIEFTDPDLLEDPEEDHTFTVDPPLFPVLPGGVINFTPGNEHVGVHLLSLTVTDADGAFDTVEWEVTVTNVNERPTIGTVEDQMWTEGTPVLLTIEANDPDVGDVLTFSDTTSIFDIGPHTGVINFTPQQMNVGKHTLRIVVTDSEGQYDDVYFEVTILAFNDPPTVSIRVVTLKERLEEGDQLSLAADVHDVDNKVSDFVYFWKLDGKEVGNEATLTLNRLRPGTHQVELRVNDGDNDVTTTYDFSVDEVEEGFSWFWIVAILIIVVVAFLGLKAWKAVQDTGPDVVERPPEPERPEPSIYEEDRTFEGWQGR